MAFAGLDDEDDPLEPVELPDPLDPLDPFDPFDPPELPEPLVLPDESEDELVELDEELSDFSDDDVVEVVVPRLSLR